MLKNKFIFQTLGRARPMLVVKESVEDKEFSQAIMVIGYPGEGKTDGYPLKFMKGEVKIGKDTLEEAIM